MERYLVEVTIIQNVKAPTKQEAEKIALRRIPKRILDRFATNVEVNWR